MLKRWLIGLVVLLLTGILVLPPLAADMDFFFSMQLNKLTWNPVVGWAAIFTNGKAARFYLVLLLLVILGLAWVLIAGSYLAYRSNMQQITPDISTPCAAGQGQFGTAKWLKKRDVHRFFAVWKIEKNDEWQALIAAGERDREVIQNAEIQTD